MFMVYCYIVTVCFLIYKTVFERIFEYLKKLRRVEGGANIVINVKVLQTTIHGSGKIKDSWAFLYKRAIRQGWIQEGRTQRPVILFKDSCGPEGLVCHIAYLIFTWNHHVIIRSSYLYLHGIIMLSLDLVTYVYMESSCYH
jgi:hypothetical protein